MIRGSRKYELKPIKVKVGDKVIRYLAGEVIMPLIVTEITDDRIVCGGWGFDPKTSAELDDDIPDIRRGFVISWIEKDE